MQPPQLGPRVLARFLDGLLLSLPVGIVARIAGMQSSTPERTVLIAVAVVAYETIAIARFGRTIGKNICHIAVIDLEGRQPALQQAFIRAVVLVVPGYVVGPKIDTFGEWLLVLFTLANLYVIAKRRDDRRGIHDLAAGTRAIADQAGRAK